MRTLGQVVARLGSKSSPAVLSQMGSLLLKSCLSAYRGWSLCQLLDPKSSKSMALFSVALNRQVTLRSSLSESLCICSLTWAVVAPLGVCLWVFRWSSLLVHPVHYIINIQRLNFVSVHQEFMFCKRVWYRLLPLTWKSASGNKRAHTSKWFKLSKIKISSLLN